MTSPLSSPPLFPTPPSRVYFHPAPEQFPAAPQNPELAAFHRRLPGYAPTPLVPAPAAAAALGVRSVWVKDESSRLGLPAYKILGASWATYRALQAHFRQQLKSISHWHSIAELAGQMRADLPLTLVAATDGNHGRAVARMARWLGLGAHILVPADMVGARRQAVVSEGARLTVIDGTYDEAVEAAARLAGPRDLVISDTAWEGYEQIPAWVIEGYATIFQEIDDQLGALGEGQPDLVSVQMGVGALASAVVQRYRAEGQHTQVVGAEPLRAACVLQSVEAGHLVDVPGPHDSVMAGLNCGRPSPVAWPFVSRGIGAFVAVADARAEEAMRLLALDGVVSGESGAAGLAGLLDLLTGPHAPEARAHLGLTASSTVLLLSTEGATDPEAYARIVGRT
ncbi:diaminopropionate ammonia-lyase [Deinococcus sp. Arct2-2]|uniref:diaminopropionate ammonia-lyase n=1 Tax=Deinococcus sp. Arct2-2 TaxID=2568653 RepID=UPI0010A40F79|nr:diaminopropionate ammonia-lyase [Deinococcus sp. Arct2-2]THF69706.1 diaminopropionate ammonia-lyase [Deinococcus sp. Arct2-2]